MEPAGVALLGLALVPPLLVLGVPIAVVLAAVACGGIFIIYAWPPFLPFAPAAAWEPTATVLATAPYDFLASYTLAALPLFILLGHLAHRAGFTGDVYKAMRLVAGRVPGGLAVATVLGCGGFSAVSGSSVACAGTMARVGIPAMRAAGYAPALAAGSVAAGGTLGSLIPPSVLLILFGVFAEESIARLFVAAVVPGLLSLAGYVAVILLWARLRPAAAPVPDDAALPAGERRRAMLRCWPVAALFALTVGGIYGGAFTPTEAAGVGVTATLALGLGLGRLAGTDIAAALGESVRQTASLFAIAMAGKLFVVFMALSGLPQALLDWLAAGQPPPAMVLAGIIALYLGLGMVLEPLGIVLLTLPLTIPVAEAQGLDLVWFGVLVVKLLEMGLVTPPIGLNAFVIHGVAGRDAPLGAIFRGAAWFLLADAAVVALLLAAPALALALPAVMM